MDTFMLQPSGLSQIMGIPMGTNCAPFVADLFLFCYERDFIMSLSEEKQSEAIEVFSSTSRYSDDILNIDNNYFRWFDQSNLSFRASIK